MTSERIGSFGIGILNFILSINKREEERVQTEEFERVKREVERVRREIDRLKEGEKVREHRERLQTENERVQTEDFERVKREVERARREIDRLKEGEKLRERRERTGLCVICQDDEANIAIVDCG